MPEPSDEQAAGLTEAAAPCFYPLGSDGYAFEWGDGSPHWGTASEGYREIRAIKQQHRDDENEPPNISLAREDAPCWSVTCDECGYRYDEDEWCSHFPSRADAEQTAKDCDWHVIDGRMLCSECALPPGSGPG